MKLMRKTIFIGLLAAVRPDCPALRGWPFSGCPDAPGPKVAFNEYEAEAHAFKLHLQSHQVPNPNPNFDGAFQAAKQQRAEAHIIVAEPYWFDSKSRS